MTDVAPETDVGVLCRNIGAGLRLLLKSEKHIYRCAAEVGMEDLDRLHSLLLRAEEEREGYYVDAQQQRHRAEIAEAQLANAVEAAEALAIATGLATARALAGDLRADHRPRGNQGKRWRMDADLLIFATRYALGRKTFAPTIVKSGLVRHQNALSVQDIDTLIRDIERHGAVYGGYGWPCDDEMWADTLDWLREMRPIIAPEETKEAGPDETTAWNPWKRAESREGMVTVYDDRGVYVGCMGRETWEKLLVEETKRRA